MWTGVVHHWSDPFSHLRVVTVDATVEAGGLLLPEGTEIKPLVAVGQQLVTFGAKLLPAVLSMAVDRDHCLYGLLLPRHPARSSVQDVQKRRHESGNLELIPKIPVG